jgi:hypothetical protein
MAMHTRPDGASVRLRPLRAVVVAYIAFGIAMFLLSPAGPLEATAALTVALAAGLLVARQGRSQS